MSTAKKTSRAATAAVPAAVSVPAPAPVAEVAPPEPAVVAGMAAEPLAAVSEPTVEAAVQAGAAPFRGFEDVVQFNHENVDALVKAASILLRGLQQYQSGLLAMVQKEVEQAVAAGKAVLGAASPQELAEIQATTAKAAFERIVGETGKLTESSAKLAEAAFAPLGRRFALVTERALHLKA